MDIIDLSQEIYTDMPVYKGLPEVKMTMHASHEEWDALLIVTLFHQVFIDWK